MKEATGIKFIGLELVKYMNWKNHIEKLLLKTNSACYVVRSLYDFSSVTTLKTIYFVYFRSVKEYDIIL